MPPRVFRDEPLREIIAFVEARIAAGSAAPVEPIEPIEFGVLDPDRGRGSYAGERVDDFVHRPWRVWVELAARLGLRLATPRVDGALVWLRFEPLTPRVVVDSVAGAEKYGADSAFARIRKLEDPGFVIDLGEALARAQLGPAPRVLDLGVNTGDELELVYAAAPDARVVGVDHAASALAIARTRFPRATFVDGDLAALASLGLALGRFDLVLAIGVLQSGALDDRALLRTIVQDHLAPTGAVILGIPNCRYVDGELVPGARMRNFRQPELGLVIKDIAFFRKYLQQHHRQVFVTGTHYLFVTGVVASSIDVVE